MQKDIDGKSTALEVHILGVDGIGLEAGNAGMVSGRVLPWLQDTPDQDVWTKWGVTYRDVVILDPDGYRVDVYNLTEHDLADSGNRAELEQRLLDRAGKP